MKNFDLSIRKLKWVGAVGVTVAVASVIAYQAHFAMGSDPSQVNLVNSVFTAAIHADREVQAPDPTEYGEQADAALAAGQVAPMPTDADRQKQSQNGQARLAQYFTQAQAQHEAVGLNNALKNESDNPNIRLIGSGASNVKITKTAVAGTTATVEAVVTVWAKSQMFNNGRWMTSNPTSIMHYTATLQISQSGQWQVSSLIGDFVPGYGP